MFTRLYLHIPFCLRKCGYCSFNSQELLDNDLNDYTSLLLEEIRLVNAAVKPERPLDSIYFGGGTPSLLNEGQLTGLIEMASDVFGVNQACEITLEANPGTIDTSRLTAFKKAGINRLSLGIQSLDDSFLNRLGRIHNSEQARQALVDARKSGFENIGIDLMHSLPGQDISNWQTNLKQAIQLSPEHFSIYGLTIEEGTPFHHRYPYNCSLEMFDQDLSADMFEMADDLLTAAGYEHYEIANYALPGFRSRHNSGYWRRDGCLGLGIGAHSFLKDEFGVRFSNVGNLDDYRVALRNGSPQHLGYRRLSQDEAMEEYMFLGLRMAEGVSLDDFELKFRCSCRSVYGNIIDELVRLDLLLYDKYVLRLTRRGMLLSNQVFSRFLL